MPLCLECAESEHLPHLATVDVHWNDGQYCGQAEWAQ